MNAVIQLSAFTCLLWFERILLLRQLFMLLTLTSQSSSERGSSKIRHDHQLLITMLFLPVTETHNFPSSSWFWDHYVPWQPSPLSQPCFAECPLPPLISFLTPWNRSLSCLLPVRKICLSILSWKRLLLTHLLFSGIFGIVSDDQAQCGWYLENHSVGAASKYCA